MDSIRISWGMSKISSGGPTGGPPYPCEPKETPLSRRVAQRYARPSLPMHASSPGRAVLVRPPTDTARRPIEDCPDVRLTPALRAGRGAGTGCPSSGPAATAPTAAAPSGRTARSPPPLPCSTPHTGPSAPQRLRVRLPDQPVGRGETDRPAGRGDRPDNRPDASARPQGIRRSRSRPGGGGGSPGRPSPASRFPPPGRRLGVPLRIGSRTAARTFGVMLRFDRKVPLIVDRHPAHRSKTVRT
jgi:hypothetical protein